MLMLTCFCQLNCKDNEFSSMITRINWQALGTGLERLKIYKEKSSQDWVPA